ncbi:hypothetical protein ACTNBM_05300 [Lachnospiraceae bacterium HCP1S3_C3]|nr:hypothetical protein [Lachnospiraceae bacterium]MDD6857754.1 hypothetical protein [Lachnospiraceae bacterium]
MTLLQAVIWYPVVFILMILVIVSAVFTGKKLRDKKDAKNANSAENAD